MYQLTVPEEPEIPETDYGELDNLDDYTGYFDDTPTEKPMSKVAIFLIVGIVIVAGVSILIFMCIRRSK